MDWKSILYQYSLHISGNQWDAEDLAQDAWLKLHDALQREPKRQVSKAYLYRIVKHIWIDRMRKAYGHTVPLSTNYEMGEVDFTLLSRELLEQLAERLPRKLSVIVLLADVFSFTVKEIAVILHMRDSAVQVSLSRARRRLKEIAQDPSSANHPSPASYHPANFDALVSAFQNQDPHAIYEAYFGLRHEGIQLTNLISSENRLYFTFSDSDGNMFQAISQANCV